LEEVMTVDILLLEVEATEEVKHVYCVCSASMLCKDITKHSYI